MTHCNILLLFPHGTDGWHVILKLQNDRKLIAMVRILLLSHHGYRKHVSFTASLATFPAILS